MGRVRPADYVLGIAGLALLRRWLGGDRGRAEEIERLVGELGRGPAGVEFELPELDVRAGYAAWVGTYDTMPNPLIRIEETVVRALIDESPAGHALDAACGTGRHAAYLTARGHRVIGVDAVPEMLAAARARHPGIDFREGSLAALPVDTASADLAVCALACSHLPDLAPALAELGRVVRPGGRVIVSDFHPANFLIGGQALFQAADGGYAFVRSYPHGPGDYVPAAIAAGLEVRRCLEPCWGEDEVPLMAGPLFALAPETFRAALVGIPGAVVWEFGRR